jgi:two-component system CheB/CheR fusion protein
MTPEETEQGLTDLLDYVKEARGFDFSGYKRASLSRRIIKRMEALGVQDFASYRDRLEVDQGEFAQLFDYILINVTGFFRDSETWDFVQQRIIPELIEGKDERDPIRVWCAGCASGEEAYSVAMLLAEALGREGFARRVKIYATDLDGDALTTARQASYSPKEVEPIPADLLNGYFARVGENFVFDKEVRRAIIFGRHDLVQDSPISRVDLLVCRNTLMYFNAETQSRIIGHFSFALNEGGYLVLGKAEMMFAHTKAFTSLDLKRRVFTKASADEMRGRSFAVGDTTATNQLTRHVRGRDAAFEAGPVAQMVLDRRGFLVMANSRARELFVISREDVGKPFRDLQVSYKPLELRSFVDSVIADRAPVGQRNVHFPSPDGDLMLDIHVDPLTDSGGALLGVSISFFDVTRYRTLQEALEHANQELETAMEELQSTNEELETTNEELQSTNEELETMNEELHSTNEELETMNDELRDRTADLHRLNAFLEGILSSVRAGVIVVDAELRVHVWNERSEDMWGIREDEARGRSLPELDIGLPIEPLREPVASVVSARSGHAEVIVEAMNRRGKRIVCRVTLSPLVQDGTRRAILMIEDADGRAAAH